MAFLKVGEENGADIELYYEDRGTGQPVILVHGWPLNGASWERQTHALEAAGYRVITYDRRGFGLSSKPSGGYDYESLATDLAKLIDHTGAKHALLAGFSMGGGELARYLGHMNTGAVTSAAFISCVTPALRKDGSNPEGVDPSVFDDIKTNIIDDRFAFLQGFLKNFYNHQMLSKTSTSDALLAANFGVASMANYSATLYTVDSWLEDFRDDVKAIDVPCLVIHGTSDQIVPFEASGKRTAAMLPNAQLHAIEGAPHGLLWTHATEVNTALMRFLKSHAA